MAEGLTLDAENSELFGSAIILFEVDGKGPHLTKQIKSLGDWSDGGTPGYIPNPVVKTVSADGTWGETPWESRSLPRDFFSFN